MSNTLPLHDCLRRWAVLFAGLLLATTVWGEATTLPGTAIRLTSSEQRDLLSAEVSSLLPQPYDTVAPALARAENWCQFLPLHFNVKACTYAQEGATVVLTVYSGRKTYQTPEDSHAMRYRFDAVQHSASRLELRLHAERGPAHTRDYRIALEARRVEAGTRLHIRSSYRPSTMSALLTRSYLATLGSHKVGFSQIEDGGRLRLVQGVRGVIERNVMRYQLAIDAFLATHTLPAEVRHEAALGHWFRQNDRYPQQLHEMAEAEYLAIKRREWVNQQRLQQAEAARLHLVAAE